MDVEIVIVCEGISVDVGNLLGGEISFVKGFARRFTANILVVAETVTRRNTTKGNKDGSV